MSKIATQDVIDLYVDGKQVSANGFTRADAIPLNQLDISFNNVNITVIKRLIEAIEAMHCAEKSKLTKPDPLSALLSEADGADAENYAVLQQVLFNEKLRNNMTRELNISSLLLLNNVKESTIKGIDAELYNDSGVLTGIIKLANRYSSANKASITKTWQLMNQSLTEELSPYYGLQGYYIERIPKSSGELTPFSPSTAGYLGFDAGLVNRIGLQAFFNQQNHNDLYVLTLMLSAQVMAENDKLPIDYDMRFVFELFSQSHS